ncbi:YciI family protein [Sulfitobacter sp. F26169L]|uniref:YciI family protein n=1 Tax=Sulfitobacter sp. F26169L TaxID=2996015 RepID=UPI002260DAE0|nr:YciI family protein [Sulfitobacter sp. F26169L]MCX7565860.1 YciI family protein [Sulfitobacter sp. F26169L]
MFVCLIARDKSGALDVRMENRPAHVEYLKSTDHVHLAGPLIDAEGSMCGSMIVLDVPDMATAETWAANDPYAKAGLFESVSLTEWKKVIG